MDAEDQREFGHGEQRPHTGQKDFRSYVEFAQAISRGA
jgi:hypothetical protein